MLKYKIAKATIEKMSHDGRGIARIEGKTTFIEGALALEDVEFYYTRKKRDFDEGRIVSVLTPSTSRVEPVCPHSTMCGGCSLQHVATKAQIDEKQAWLLDAMMRVGHVQPEEVLPPLVAELWHYRNKARLSVRYVEKKQATLVGFREKHNPRYITDIKTCHVLNARVDVLIPSLRLLFDTFESPHAIAQIEVAVGDTEMAFILRNLAPLSTHDEHRLKAFATEHQIHLFLQPAGPDSVYRLYSEKSDDFLSYALPDYGLTMQFHPTDFTQINSGMNRLMVKQALGLLSLKKTDVALDLFCGLGNFSLAMATQCSHVTGVEGSAAMVLRAQMNAQVNGLTNTAFYCGNLDDEVPFKMIPKTRYTHLLLDPPRTGAAVVCAHMNMLKPERIVYVSCNPMTAARDSAILVHEKGYKLKKLGVLDMFPHTTHVESMALFEQG